MSLRQREKIFSLGRWARPADIDDKRKHLRRLHVWNAAHKQPGQHQGPITAAGLRVAEALLFGFHNAVDGACFPSYEAIAEKARCARSTVHLAIHALEAAGFLTWANQIVRFTERVLGKVKVVIHRTSNAYAFTFPSSPPESHKSENPTGYQTQDIQRVSCGSAILKGGAAAEMEACFARWSPDITQSGVDGLPVPES